MQKPNTITKLFLEILQLEEFCNLIGQEYRYGVYTRKHVTI